MSDRRRGGHQRNETAHIGSPLLVDSDLPRSAHSIGRTRPRTSLWRQVRTDPADVCRSGRRPPELGQGPQSNSSTRRRASSIASSSSWPRRPTNSPSRSCATADVCSMSTWVSSPSMATVGRKILGADEREVGATSTVDSIRSPDWRRTAYRAPCCSWPRVALGARRAVDVTTHEACPSRRGHGGSRPGRARR